MFHALRIFFIIMFNSVVISVYAQSQEKIYSLYLLNFARGINWPAYTQTDKFVIGVLEYPPLVNELKSSISNTRINGKQVEVRDFSDPEQITRCQILFLPSYKNKLLPIVLEKIRTDPTLIVTNRKDMAREGAGIDLVLLNGKLTYEINCREIEARGMKISAGVKSIGTEITP